MKFRILIGLVLALSTTSCYVESCCFGPPGVFDVFTFPGGPGTTFREGAIDVAVNPDGFFQPGQYYDIQVVGFGTVPLPPGPNQGVNFGFLRPGTYRLRCWVYCFDPWDPYCFSNQYEILLDVFPGTTTAVDFFP